MMGQEQFNTLMPMIAADLVRLIVEKEGISEEAAIRMLYSSQLFAALEQESTKVWHYSTPMLYELLKQEVSTGKLSFPDG